MKNKLVVGRYVLFAVSVVCIAGMYGCGFPQNPSDNKGSQDVSAEMTDGERLYKRSCKSCHSLGPPPKFGPPIKGIARHYREAFADKNEAVEHMVTFMQKPDVSLSKCRPEAVRRFGLMPAMNLPVEELRVVSDWLWEQFDPELKHHHDSVHHH